MTEPLELDGLSVSLDRLVYRFDTDNTAPNRPHIFIYFLTISNNSPSAVTLLGRRWVLENEDGSQSVVEGDKIVGECPFIPAGGHFTYNSFHICGGNAVARGSFHGVDEAGNHVWVRIPPIAMNIPPKKEHRSR